MQRQQRRFVDSRCDRCGRGTPARQNGTHDLFTLPHEWPEPLSDLGSFCQRCLDRYSLEDWQAWYQQHEEKPTCEYCGKPVTWATPAHADTGRGRFCNRHCQTQWQAKVKEKDWPSIVRLHTIEGLTAGQIGQRYGCTSSVILKGLRRFNAVRHGSPGDRNGMFGQTHTPEARAKIREANRRQFSTEEARQRHAELTVKQIQDGRTGKTFNKLEQTFAAILDSAGIAYQWQAKLSRYVFDFLIYQSNTLIEVHGSFWHADPRFYDRNCLKPAQSHNVENDIRKEAAAVAAGFRFMRFWEYDIHNNPDQVKAQILAALT